MDVSDFDFDLPPEAIAQRPAPRGTSRLMTLDRASGAIGHRSVADLPSLLRTGDLLVVNDTRVVPARLFGVDAEGRRTEFLLVEKTEDASAWDCLAKPGRRAKPGRSFDFGAGLSGTVAGKGESGHYRVVFSGTPLEEALPLVGTTPLPPYIHREGGVADGRDAVDYQTVYAREPGAIAAPTAGLHLTPELLDALRARGVEVASVTLHVGIGTFKPVKADRVEEHRMDVERGIVPDETAEAVRHAKEEGRRVVAVGTTSVRTLEASARAHGGRVAPGPFETRLFLVPGAEFLVVDALLTNFHLPRSTLLMLVSAFAGRESVLAAYREAVAAGYRFFSYGDAMLVG
ncbi:MAG: tRNA preQ1(34) S-adenosylmethionine ribosyltransferase-isomerase QueA [Thermoanaerobaculia bacterium]